MIIVLDRTYLLFIYFYLNLLFPELRYPFILQCATIKTEIMSQYPKIILKPAKEASLKRFHPWVFSGALIFMKTEPQEGDIVEVFSYENKYLATGHFCKGSIAVKVFSFKQGEIGPDFWRERLLRTFELRKQLGLTSGNLTNAYRLVNMEGDGLPGLVIDFYNGVAVIQIHNAGMYNARIDLGNALKEIYGVNLETIYYKTVDFTPPTSHSAEDASGRISSEPITITETGHKFLVDIEKGQKTGFFLDQRGNRMFAQFYGRGRKVLNAFCYSGAFSVYALKGGATSVHSIDSSRQAIAWVKENMNLNGIPENLHTEEVADVKRFLTETSERYDMIILDPPAFAKHHNISHNALQAYIYINAQAMKRLNPGGILLTFSCSQAINREMFRSAIQAAAIETGKNIKILHQLSQGPDHPISIFHPEGEYLKGLILEAD